MCRKVQQNPILYKQVGKLCDNLICVLVIGSLKMYFNIPGVMGLSDTY